MGDRRVRKADGSTTVIRTGAGGGIVGNLPGSRALHPANGESLGSEAAQDTESPVTSVDSLYTLYSSQSASDGLDAAQKDFQSWVLHAAFASEGDSTRGRFWEGATRYATTPDGRNALERIAANSETTPSLRSAANAMLAEVELYGDDIREAWVVPASGAEEQPPIVSPFVEDTAYVSSDSQERISPDTRVLGASTVSFRSQTEGSVTLHNATLYDASVTDSVIEDSSLEHVKVARSTVEHASISYQRYASTDEQALFPTSVSGSVIGPGASVRGATVEDSTVQGEVVGTGAAEANLINRTHIREYYESFVNGFGETSSEHARPRIGEIAEEATHARVIRSAVGPGSKVRNAHLNNTILKDGADVEMAVVENVTIGGTAHVAGSFRHELKTLQGYRLLKEIIPRDRRARVANVTLTREFIGEAAEVTKPSHVECVTKDGVVVTRYRTRFRTRLRRPVWAYTTTTVNPASGSMVRSFVGYESGSETSPAVRQLMRMF